MERIADTLDCVKHGALPLQPGPDGVVIGGDGPLCLNIWVPRDATPRSRFPVMVWVPGAVPFAVHKTMSDLTGRILLPTAAFWLRSPIA